jgi:hypothetical protein
MLKKIFIPLILILIPCLFSLNQAIAHSLKNTGTISALMHINPNEDPVAGKESEILFLINDKDKKFQPENCDCQASVMFGTTTLLNQQVSTAKTSYRGIFAPAIPFTFPQKGIYNIKLTGEPKNEQSFPKIFYNIQHKSR